MSSDLDRDSLKIGDFVTFQDAHLNCYLSVEGKYFYFDITDFKLSQQFNNFFFYVRYIGRRYRRRRRNNIFT
jgi:hypothetical protein